MLLLELPAIICRKYTLHRKATDKTSARDSDRFAPSAVSGASSRASAPNKLWSGKRAGKPAGFFIGGRWPRASRKGSE